MVGLGGVAIWRWKWVCPFPSQGRSRQLCMIIGFMNKLNGFDKEKLLERIKGMYYNSLYMFSMHLNFHWRSSSGVRYWIIGWQQWSLFPNWVETICKHWEPGFFSSSSSFFSFSASRKKKSSVVMSAWKTKVFLSSSASRSRLGGSAESIKCQSGCKLPSETLT